MQKANVENVKKLFEDDGWKVEVDYSGDCIRLDASKTVQTESSAYSNEYFKVKFAFTKEDMENETIKQQSETPWQVRLLGIQEYIAEWKDKVIYSGTPLAVQLYEAEFGASSAADDQVVTWRFENERELNLQRMKAKSVAKVEDAFKKAGYVVDLSAYYKGEAEEAWDVHCNKPNTLIFLFAHNSYNGRMAKIHAEEQIPFAQSQNVQVKHQDNWSYYGSPEAIELFESLGGGDINVIYTPPEPDDSDECVKVENAFKNAGYGDVRKTPMGEITMLICMKSDPFSMLTAMLCSSAEEAQEQSQIYGAAATNLNMELKFKGNWFYYGNPDSVAIFESVIK